MPDHLGNQLSPLAALTAAAAATTRLRVGAFVFANDYRPPLILAREAATLDLLSGGRFEMSMGVLRNAELHGRAAAAPGDRPGISYYTIPGRAMEAMAPLVEALSGR